MRGLIDEIDHQVSVIARTTRMRSTRSTRRRSCAGRGDAARARLARREGERRALQWTLGLYGTPAMAAEAGLSEEEYWEQIVHACFLDDAGPDRALARGGSVERDRARRLDALESSACTCRARTSTCGSARRAAALARRDAGATSRASRSSPAPTGAARRAGSTATSRCTATATSSAASACVRRGPRRRGRSAEENERVLSEMIATEGADRIGEFSLTDRRFSRITRFMAQTLYDENFGGAYGNTHIAARPRLPGRLRRRPREVEQRSGSSSASTSSVPPTSSRPATASSRRSCGAAASA